MAFPDDDDGVDDDDANTLEDDDDVDAFVAIATPAALAWRRRPAATRTPSRRHRGTRVVFGDGDVVGAATIPPGARDATPAPRLVGPPARAGFPSVDVAAGKNHVAVMTAEEVYAWGAGRPGRARALLARRS